MEDTLGVEGRFTIGSRTRVLILVLMEDTLGVIRSIVTIVNEGSVLILVLMEDTLGGVLIFIMNAINLVLILVLMEDTLGAMCCNKFYNMDNVS